jgi:homoserine kinase type II
LRAQFETDELKAVLREYDLGRVGRVDRHIKGSRHSPKLILTTDRGRYLLKRRASGRDHPMKVTFAHQVQRYLAERDFPLPRVVPVRSDDDTMVIINDRIYEIFEYVEGVSYNGSWETTFDAGRVLGEFHNLVADFMSDWAPSRKGYHDSSSVRTNLSRLPASIGNDDSVVGKESELLGTVSSLYETYERAAEAVNDAGFAEWPEQIVHADWHPGNMLFREDRVAAVIDYDSLRLLPRATDLANGLLQFSIVGGPIDPIKWPPELDEERFRRFLLGYDQMCVASGHQMACIPSLMIEALIAEAVMPIAATGSFGRMEGFRFLQMINRKVHWLEQNRERLIATARVN